jgi:hypothetical protein
MRLTAFFLLLTTAIASAQTAMEKHEQGYRDCNLHKLDACEDSNQLFFGPLMQKPAKGKPETLAALRRFLRGARKTYMVFAGRTDSFDVAESAIAQFTGPDGPPEHLPTGEWLFRGFEPHASPFSAYVMFDASGHILLVGMIDTSTDIPKAPEHHADYVLRIYSRSGEPQPDIVAKWQNWAREAVGDKSAYPGAIPPNRFVGTELFIAKDNKWSSHWLDR